MDMIVDLTLSDVCSWENIMVKVGEKFRVSNWLDIRSVIQLLSHAGFLKRYEDITVEKYVIRRDL